MGDVQAANAAPSRAHWNVPASFDEKVNVALVLVVVEGGPESIVVSGGVVSSGGPEPTLHVQVAGVGSVLEGCAASVARTRKLWSPSASPE